MPRHEEFDDLLIGGDAAATDADLSTKADQSEVDSLSTTVDSLSTDVDTIGLTDRNPDGLTVGATHTAILEMRRFERFRTESISIADGGSVHIRRLRHLTPP